MADDTKVTVETTDATSDDQTADATSEDTELGDKGKQAIQAERQKARDAAKRAKDAEDRLARIEADQKRKADADAVEQGKFQELAETRAQELEQATGKITTLQEERDALAARVSAYEDRDRATIKEGIKDLPDDLKAFDPGDDATLDQRLAWFTKAQSLAAKRQGDPVRGNGRSPEYAAGRDAKADEAALANTRQQIQRDF